MCRPQDLLGPGRPLEHDHVQHLGAAGILDLGLRKGKERDQRQSERFPPGLPGGLFMYIKCLSLKKVVRTIFNLNLFTVKGSWGIFSG